MVASAAPTATHATTPTAMAGVNRYGWTPPRISRPLTIAKRYPIGTRTARAVMPFWPARHEDTPSHVTMPREPSTTNHQNASTAGMN